MFITFSVLWKSQTNPFSVKKAKRRVASGIIVTEFHRKVPSQSAILTLDRAFRLVVMRKRTN